MGAIIKYYPQYGEIISTGTGKKEFVEIDFADYGENYLSVCRLVSFSRNSLNVGYFGFAYKSTDYNLRGAEVALEFFESEELYEKLLSFASLAQKHKIFVFAEDKDLMGFAIPVGKFYAGTKEIILKNSAHELSSINFNLGDKIAIVSVFKRAFQVTQITSASGTTERKLRLRDVLNFDVEPDDCYVVHAHYFPFALTKDISVRANDFRTFTFKMTIIEPSMLLEEQNVSVIDILTSTGADLTTVYNSMVFSSFAT